MHYRRETTDLWRRPAARAAIFYTLLFFLCYQYCRTHSYRDPGSGFFDPDRAFVEWYTAHRHGQADEFMAHAARLATEEADSLHNKTRYVKAGRDARVCATFITVKREISQQYIDVSFTSTLWAPANGPALDWEHVAWFDCRRTSRL